MPSLPPFQAVLFDMDGLVLDTEPAYARAWQQAAAGFGVALDDEFLRGLFGRHADDVDAALRGEIGEAFDRGRFHARAARHWRQHVAAFGVPAMPGIGELLALLDRQRIPYALATNSDGPQALECLRLAGLESAFERIISRDQVAAGKPAPDVFVEAARRVGVAPRECLALEDSATGLLAARRAGTIPTLVLDRPAPPNALALAAAHFPSLRELAAAVLSSASCR